MEKFKTLFVHKIFKIIKWAFFILVVAYFILVIFRVFHLFNVDKTNEQVAKIHATKLQLSDVMGDNLPPDPGEEADKTVAGIDANGNGIRDDVELAIFKEYPNSAKIRAVLLQYALALQMQMTLSIINEKTATEVVTELSRADTCIADTLLPREDPGLPRYYSDVEKINNFINFVEELQLNTDIRKKIDKDFYTNLRSYGDSTNVTCDIDMRKLSN